MAKKKAATRKAELEPTIARIRDLIRIIGRLLMHSRDVNQTDKTELAKLLKQMKD